ncbi:uncharacterized protein LOC117327712 [Pecten maximus]|uniref:uncharacterized protein LOC117327712 n=1 Tax=Pecten maximus TaxID=6579 RepID=UPI001458738A|nr:uncharacterized protein LOC117327712 [Pecten maximus]
MGIRRQTNQYGTVLWFTLLLLSVCSVLSETGCSKQFSIETVGFHTVVKGDNALVLYTDIFNGGNVTVHVKIIVKKCCLFLPGEIFCKGMKLIGNHQGDVQPSKSKQFNFVYPTLYPYDRKGECDLLVSANTSCDMNYQEVTIPFDTRVQMDWWTDWLPHSVQTVLFGVGVRDCRGVDEDRLRLCVPVNCQLKYGGTRNFFNSTERKCMAVPKCGTQLYDPVSNECREPTDHLNKEIYIQVFNKSRLQTTSEEAKNPNWRTLVGPRLDCGHGQLSHDNLDCKCDQHWTTHTKKLRGQGEITAMCNVYHKVARTSKMSLVIIFASSVLFLMAVVVICLYVRARSLEKRTYQPGTCSTEKESCFPILHNNWKSLAGTSKETSHMMGHVTGADHNSPLAAEEDSQDEI